MTTVLAFCPGDGYDESSYIAPMENLYPAIRFKFRPTSHEERDGFFELNRKAGNNQAQLRDNSLSFLLRKLKSWDLRDGAGNPVPLTRGILQQLKPAVFDRMFLIVAGQSAGDADPEANKEDTDREGKIKDLMSSQPGLVYADAAAEIDRKNS